MIQLSENLYWDENLEFKSQTVEVQEFVNNIISTDDSIDTVENIPMSTKTRTLTETYILDTEDTIIKTFTYVNVAKSAGWAQIESFKITCNGE